MHKVRLLTKEITFEYDSNGERLFCCVSKADFEQFGVKCPLLLDVVKGISDDELEAKDDYLVQVALTMNLGLEDQENNFH